MCKPLGVSDRRNILDELPGRACSIAAALEVVGDRWSLLAVREVSFGNHRFSEIVAGTGAPRDLLPVLRALMSWGDRWAVDEPPVTLVHAGHEFRPTTVCATCGEPVHAGDVHRRVTERTPAAG
jgi:DNA-binding HxlR family transcriptional regulator